MSQEVAWRFMIGSVVKTWIRPDRAPCRHETATVVFNNIQNRQNEKPTPPPEVGEKVEPRRVLRVRHTRL